MHVIPRFKLHSPCMVPKSTSAYIRINVSSCVLCANPVCLPAWTHFLFPLLNNAPIPPEVSPGLSRPLSGLFIVCCGQRCRWVWAVCSVSNAYSGPFWLFTTGMNIFYNRKGFAVCLWLLYSSDVFWGIFHCLRSPWMHVCVCDWNDPFPICINNIVLN